MPASGPSELLKLRTTATTVVLLLAAGGLTVLAVLLEGLSPTVSDLAARGVDLALTGTHALLLVLGTIAVSALSAMLGVAVGALIRNQAGAIVAVVAYSVAVDATLFATVPAFARWLPGKAGDALIGLPRDHLLDPPVAAAVLAAWTLAFVIAAMVHNDRTDV